MASLTLQSSILARVTLLHMPTKVMLLLRFRRVQRSSLRSNRHSVIGILITLHFEIPTSIKTSFKMAISNLVLSLQIMLNVGRWVILATLIHSMVDIVTQIVLKVDLDISCKISQPVWVHRTT